MPPLPWSEVIRTHYLSGAANQFLLHGNVNDRLLLPADPEAPRGARIGNLADYLIECQLRKFDLVIGYELGAGLRVETGEDLFRQLRPGDDLPKDPPAAIAYLDHLLRFLVNLRQLKPGETPPRNGAGQAPSAPRTTALAGRNLHVAILLHGADLLFPRTQATPNYQLSAMASLVKAWSKETHFLGQNLAVFLIAENLNDLHPLLATNPRSTVIDIDLPGVPELLEAFGFLAGRYPKALSQFAVDPGVPAARLAGATLSSIESLLKTREHLGLPLAETDLADLKKSLVEKDSQGLIEFVEPSRTLGDYQGAEAVKEWLRQDIALWRQGDLQAMPMGYLLCGPVGTGKTFLVECLAGEAGVPVVKLKNFRDRWVGSTEGNLEKIFNLLHALGRCIVFIDEADQALGSRESGSGDSGVSGRVYSMMAKEMSDGRNRGRILWILASSRPDLIEVDLKRPGRVDVKIPLFPSHDPLEAYRLIRAIGKRFQLDLPKDPPETIRPLVPNLVTPGAAESIAIKAYRLVKTRGVDAVEALRDCLDEYQTPVPRDVMDAQIDLAVRESSDLAFVPEPFRSPSGNR